MMELMANATLHLLPGLLSGHDNQQDQEVLEGLGPLCHPVKKT